MPWRVVCQVGSGCRRGNGKRADRNAEVRETVDEVQVQPLRHLVMMRAKGDQDLVVRPLQQFFLDGLVGVVSDGDVTGDGRGDVRRDLGERCLKAQMRVHSCIVMLWVAKVNLRALWVGHQEVEPHRFGGCTLSKVIEELC